MRARIGTALALMVAGGTAAGMQNVSSSALPPSEIPRFCADTLRDRVNGACLPASSMPQLGALYPLSADLFLDAATGWVGLGTVAPSARLTVAGNTHSRGSLAFARVTDGLSFSSDNPLLMPSVPMLTLFTSGTANPDRMLVAHSASFPSYGLSYRDSTDTFAFQTSPGSPVLTIDLQNRAVRADGQLRAVLLAGSEPAIEGSANGNLACGVRGTHNASPYGFGVYGLKTQGNGYGVYGDAVDGGGVYGTGQNGVIGHTNVPNGYGLYSFGQIGATGTKQFIQPHPSDPSKEIRYVALEGNEAGTYFRGASRLIDGRAVIEVPEDFRLVTEEAGMTVQVTALADVRLWVEEYGLEQIVVRGHDDAAFHYMVNGVRRGFGGHEPIQENRAFVPRYLDEPFAVELPQAVRDILVESGVLRPDYTPDVRTAARLGWSLTEAPKLDAAGTAGR